MKHIETESDWFAHPDEFREKSSVMWYKLIAWTRWHPSDFNKYRLRWLILKYAKLTQHAFYDHARELYTIFRNWLTENGSHPIDSTIVSDAFVPLSNHIDLGESGRFNLWYSLGELDLHGILHNLLNIFFYSKLLHQLQNENIEGRERIVENHFCDEFRCVVGNPFRPVTIDPAWRRSEILELADTIDAGERFDLMPILADALEDAGCHDPQVLSHCRDWKIHARGCWLIDGLLNRPINLREPTSGRKSMFDPIP